MSLRQRDPAMKANELGQLVRQQHAREQSCLFVPCWLLAIALTVLAGWVRSAPAVASSSELPLTGVLGGASPSSSVSGPGDVAPWLQAVVLPLLLQDGGVGATAVPGWRLLGGVRVSQWVTAPAACGGGAGMRLTSALGLSQACRATDDARPLLAGRWVEGGASPDALPPFLTGGAVGDAEAALASLRPTPPSRVGRGSPRAVKCAFEAVNPGSAWLGGLPAPAGAVIASGYHLVLPVGVGTVGGSESVEATVAGGWMEPGGTAYVRVEAVGVNPTASRWLALTWDFTFLRGGSVKVASMAGSLPLDPTSPAPDQGGWGGVQSVAPALDAVALLVALVLLANGLWGASATAGWWTDVVRGVVVRRTGSGGASTRDKGATQDTRAGPVSAATLLASVQWSWEWVLWALDVACAVGIFTSIYAWSGMRDGLSALLSSSTPAAGVLAEGDGLPLTAPCYGKSTEDVASATLTLHAMLGVALDAQALFRKASGASVALLTCRALRSLALQPRLALLVDSFTASLGDLSHFGAIFLLLLLGHALWAGLAFGSQAPDFSDLPTGLFALLRMSMFDYSLDPLIAQDAPGASVFYATFMIGVTNIVLWTWLGIILETYSVARNAVRERPRLPTLVQDVQSGLVHAPTRLKELGAAVNAVLCGCASVTEGGTRRVVSRGVAQQLVDDAADGSEADGGGVDTVVPRHVMLSCHAAVLAVVQRHTAASMHASQLAAGLGVSNASALVILQHYVAGDDISALARMRLLNAVLDVAHPTQGGQRKEEEGSSASAGSGVVLHAGHSTDWQGGVGGGGVGSGSQDPTAGSSGSGTRGAADEWGPAHAYPGAPQPSPHHDSVTTHSGTTRGEQRGGEVEDSSPELPTSPLATGHASRYVAIGGLMVRRPSTGGAGTGLNLDAEQTPRQG